MKGTAGFALCAVFGLMLACPVEAGAASKRGAQHGRSTASASHAATGAQAHAGTRHGHGGSRHAGTRSSRRGGTSYASSGGISCVPYARMVSGIQITGNGGQWWHNAAGAYDRGQRPEPGSILAFASSGGMRSGHVAVVSQVHGPRHVEIDHANWAGPGIRRGTVMHNVDVIDVSERNDWTQVRVQVGWDSGTYGRVYPTYGFIYNRPARGMMAAFTGNTMSASAQPVSAQLEEIAEAPRTAPSRRGSSRRAAR